MIYEFVGEIFIIYVGIEYMYLLIYVNFFMIYFLYFEREKKEIIEIYLILFIIVFVMLEY